MFLILSCYLLLCNQTQQCQINNMNTENECHVGIIFLHDYHHSMRNIPEEFSSVNQLLLQTYAFCDNFEDVSYGKTVAK